MGNNLSVCQSSSSVLPLKGTRRVWTAGSHPTASEVIVTSRIWFGLCHLGTKDQSIITSPLLPVPCDSITKAVQFA